MNKYLLILTLLFCSCCTGITTASAKEVVVLLDSRIRPYVEALAGFKEHSSATIKVLERRENGSFDDEKELITVIRSRKPDQILAIGTEALAAITSEIRDIPIIFCMVLSPDDKLKNAYGNLTGVSLDVSPERQIKVLNALLPEKRNVSSLYNPDETASLIKAMQQALAKKNISLHAQAVSSPTEAMKQIESAFKSSDVYWMVADKNMHSKDLLRYLFFSSRQKGKALIGLSDKYVRAGALFAFTVDNEAVGRQVANISNRILNGTKPNQIPVQMANEAVLSINTKVAKLLGAQLPEALLNSAEHIY